MAARLGLLVAALLATLLTVPARAIEPGFPRDIVQALLATAYEVILDRHLDAASPADLGLWTLRGLAALDPELQPEARAGTLLLSGPGGRLLATRPVPAPPPGGPGAAPGGPSVQAASPLAIAVAALMDAAWRASPALRRAGHEAMLEAAFEELFTHLDPYSRYQTPQQAAATRARRIGHSAMGMTLRGARDGALMVGAVEPGGTAARVGLRAGDRLLAVDGIPLSARAREEAELLLEGPIGTAARVLLQRGGRRLEITLPREAIAPDTIRAERRDEILWLRIQGFAADTDRRLAEALRAGLAAGPVRGIVLDLRGNRGGLVSQATAVASAFLEGGLVARTVGRHPDAMRRYEADGTDRGQGLPMVVLVDGRTASAAEILAAALSDRGRAVVVGSVTQGKGLVQVVAPLPNGGELTVSWARVLAPLGWPIQELGVLPVVCTSLGGEAIAAQLGALRRGEPPPMAAALARRRALPTPVPGIEAAALREACPPAEGREADLAVARALIDSPAAYAAARGL